MKQTRRIPIRRIATVALIALVLAALAALAACQETPPPLALGGPQSADPPVFLEGANPSGVTHFNNIETTDGTFTDDVDISDDLTVSDDLTTTGDATIGGDFSATGDTSLDQTTITDTATDGVYSLELDVESSATSGTIAAFYLDFDTTAASGTVDTYAFYLNNNPAHAGDDVYTMISTLAATDAVTYTIDDAFNFFGTNDMEDMTADDAMTYYGRMPTVDEGTIDTSYGLYLWEAPKGSGTINTSYGIYIADVDQATTNWAIYAAGGDSYHAGDWNYAIGTTAITTDTALVATDSGSLITNQGASGAAIATLPDAAAGLHYCFYTFAAQNFDINPADADQIHHLTDAAGDAIRNATAGDKVCLVAVDGTYWVPVEEHGTWSDVN